MEIDHKHAYSLQIVARETALMFPQTQLTQISKQKETSSSYPTNATCTESVLHPEVFAQFLHKIQ